MSKNIDIPKATNYFVINQSDAAVIEFVYEPKKKKVIREQKGAKGMIYMAISSLAYTLMAFLLKLLYIKSSVSTFEVTYWQSIMMAFLNFFLFKAYTQDHLKVPMNMRRTLVLRSIFGFFGMTGYYLALQYTDLSKATTLYWTNPVFTAVFAYFMLDEVLNFIDWLAIFVSFFGILVIQNPWASQSVDESEQHASLYDTLGSLAAIGGAISFSISQMQTRKLGKRVHFLVPPFYQAIFSAFVAPLIMFIMLRYRQNETTKYGWYECYMLLLISLSFFIAQVFQTKSYQNDKAGRVAPVNQLQIIYNYVLDYVVLRTHPSSSEIIGGVLIVGSNLTISILRCFNIIK